MMRETRWIVHARRRSLIAGCWLLMAAYGLGCVGKAQADQITLATTTSTQDTGLLDALVPVFRKQTGIEVKVIAVGTGQALALARRGDADVVLVHSRKAEDQFVADGFGVNRHEVMYNDFVLVGPASDSARVKGERSAAQALAKIAQAKATFVSRGDDSGTHQEEQELWQTAKLKPGGDWYLSAGSGMAETLRLADEKNGYTLSDRSTFLSQRKRLRLVVLVEGDKALLNPYGVMAVNPQKLPHVNHGAALKFVSFLRSPETQKLISEFGKDRYGQPLFSVYP